MRLNSRLLIRAKDIEFSTKKNSIRKSEHSQCTSKVFHCCIICFIIWGLRVAAIVCVLSPQLLKQPTVIDIIDAILYDRWCSRSLNAQSFLLNFDRFLLDPLDNICVQRSQSHKSRIDESPFHNHKNTSETMIP